MPLNILISDSRGKIGNLVFSAFGLLIIWFAIAVAQQSQHDLQEFKAMRFWSSAPAVIMNSDIEDDGEDFRLALTYQYKVGSKTLTAYRYGADEEFTADTYGEVAAEQKHLSVGKTVTIHYNPENPYDAVLNLPDLTDDRPSFIGVVIMVAFGFLFTAGPWLADYAVKRASGKSYPRLERGMLAFFGLAFVAMSAAFFKPATFDPIRQARETKKWISVSATVEASKVKSSIEDGNDVYKPYIAYRYELDGEEYIGDRYSIMEASSSGKSAKEKIVREYPVGHVFSVFVNPTNPSESVINRDSRASFVFCVFPFMFIGIGWVLLAKGLRLPPYRRG